MHCLFRVTFAKISAPTDGVRTGMIIFYFDALRKILDCPIQIALVKVSTATAAVSLCQPRIERHCPRIVINRMLMVFIVFFVIGNSEMKLSISVYMKVLLSNKSMEIIVDALRTYIMVMVQVSQHRLFQGTWNSDYVIGLNEAIWW